MLNNINLLDTIINHRRQSLACLIEKTFANLPTSQWKFETSNVLKDKVVMIISLGNRQKFSITIKEES